MNYQTCPTCDGQGHVVVEHPKCRFCGERQFPVDQWGNCEACNEGMARTNGD